MSNRMKFGRNSFPARTNKRRSGMIPDSEDSPASRCVVGGAVDFSLNRRIKPPPTGPPISPPATSPNVAAATPENTSGFQSRMFEVRCETCGRAVAAGHRDTAANQTKQRRLPQRLGASTTPRQFWITPARRPARGRSDLQAALFNERPTRVQPDAGEEHHEEWQVRAFGGALSHSGSMVTSHVHHCASILVSNLGRPKI